MQRQQDIILLTATKLVKGSDILSIVNVPGYAFIHSDSLALAGGVAMYVNGIIKFDVHMNISIYNSFAESMWINIHNKNVKTTLGVVYR